MILTCDCSFHDDVDWFYEPQNVAPLSTKRSRKCCSCGERIAVGEDSIAFIRYRHPEPGSVAERIYGEYGDEPLATWYLCDRCAGLYESLDYLGFCNLLGHDMRELCREYAEMQRDAGVFRGSMVINKEPA